MYENAGGILKNAGSTIRVSGCIASGVLAFGLFILSSHLDSTVLEVTTVVSAIIIFVIGCLISWFSGLLLYAFGEVVDRLGSIDVNVRHLSSNNASAPAPVSVNPTTRSVVESAPRTSAPTPSNWTCPCGRVNAAYVGTYTCGKSKRDAVK